MLAVNVTSFLQHCHGYRQAAVPDILPNPDPSRTRRVARRRVAGRRAGEPDRWRPTCDRSRILRRTVCTQWKRLSGRPAPPLRWMAASCRPGRRIPDSPACCCASGSGKPLRRSVSAPVGICNRWSAVALVVLDRGQPAHRRRRGAVLDLCRGFRRIQCQLEPAAPHRDRVHRPGAAVARGSRARRRTSRIRTVCAVAGAMVSWLDPGRRSSRSPGRHNPQRQQVGTVMVSGQGS